MNVIVFSKHGKEIGRADLDTAIIRKRGQAARLDAEYQKLIDTWKADPDNIIVTDESGELIEEFPM